MSAFRVLKEKEKNKDELQARRRVLLEDQSLSNEKGPTVRTEASRSTVEGKQRYAHSGIDEEAKQALVSSRSKGKRKGGREKKELELNTHKTVFKPSSLRNPKCFFFGNELLYIPALT